MSRILTLLKTQRLLLLAIVVVLAAFFLAALFIKPAPPQHLLLAAGEKGGTYAYFAQRYAETLKKQKISVDIVYTQGSGENLARLQDPKNPVDIAFIQGGEADSLPAGHHLRAIAAIYFEPLWVFYPKTKMVAQLRDLKGRRLAIGLEGSGTRRLSERLLAWNGITAENTTFLSLPLSELVEAMKQGRVDAIFYVGAAQNPIVTQLIQIPGLTLHSFNDAYAYVRKFNFLSSVLIPEGVLSMADHQPDRNTTLLASSALLVAHDDFSPQLVSLLLTSAKEINGSHGLLQDSGMFPTAHMVDFPLHDEAKRYLQSGPPLLQRFLPYHIAAFIDRTKILLLPLITLLFPLLRITPPLYGWSIRRRIFRWYKALFKVETDFRRGSGTREELQQRLEEIEAKVMRQQVPLAYAAELYCLRQHIQMVRDLLSQTPVEVQK
jgi:TRAP transporter TAXI family solute receptor